MVITPRQRKQFLGVALGLTLFATYQASQDEPVQEATTIAEPVKTTHDAATTMQPPVLPAIALSRLERERPYSTPGKLFYSQSWFVTPPPPRFVAPAITYTPPAPIMTQTPIQSAPSAPPLPFSYMGKVRYGDQQWRFFLVTGTTMHTVREGDVVLGNYKIEGLVNGRLEITYLPLNIKQSLTIGERS